MSSVISLKGGATEDVSASLSRVVLFRNCPYRVNDRVAEETLTAGFYLLCTSSGTTSSEPIDFSTAASGDSIVDGTVTWQVCGNIATLAAYSAYFRVDENGNLVVKEEPDASIVSTSDLVADGGSGNTTFQD